MHMLKYYESFKMGKECMRFNDKVKDLNVFINVFWRNVLLMVTLNPL